MTAGSRGFVCFNNCVAVVTRAVFGTSKCDQIHLIYVIGHESMHVRRAAGNMNINIPDPNLNRLPSSGTGTASPTTTADMDTRPDVGLQLKWSFWSCRPRWHRPRNPPQAEILAGEIFANLKQTGSFVFTAEQQERFLEYVGVCEKDDVELLPTGIRRPLVRRRL